MRELGAGPTVREDIVPEVGRRLVVRCDAAKCDHAALLDPKPLFGSPRHWPPTGSSYRFRCQCGHRVSRVSYTHNADQAEGPISSAALKLWF